MRAQAGLALAVRGASVEHGTATRLAASEDPVVGAAAVATDLVLHRGVADDAILDALLQTPTLDDEDELPWCGGSPAGLVADALTRYDDDEDRVVEVLLRALQAWRVAALLRRSLTDAQRRAAFEDACTGAYAIDSAALAAGLEVAE